MAEGKLGLSLDDIIAQNAKKPARTGDAGGKRTGICDVFPARALVALLAESSAILAV